jgi:hypothetical protein
MIWIKDAVRTSGQVWTMSKRSPKTNRRSKALPALGFAGVSLSMASGACASTSEASANTPSPSQNHEIFLGEEEISDVSLATFYVFDNEKCRTAAALPKTKTGRRRRCRLWLWLRLCLRGFPAATSAGSACNAADTASKETSSKEEVSARTKRRSAPPLSITQKLRQFGDIAGNPTRHIASAIWCVKRSTKLFDERSRRCEIGKAPTKIGLPSLNNSPSVSDLNPSRSMEIHHPAAQLDTQFVGIDEKLDDE